jgi:AraC-like DNA-binding protein
MHDKEPDGISFDTDALPERDRFPAFCEGMFRHVIGADIVQRGSTPFRGSLQAKHAGPVIIADIATTPSDIIRGTAHIADGNDAVVFLLWQQGLGLVAQGDRENQLDTSNALMIDNARTATLSAEANCRFWGLTIPRNKFAGVAPNVFRLLGSKLNDNRQSLRLLSGYLTFARDLGDTPTARLFGDHLIDLVSLAVAGDANASGLEDRGGIRAARFSAVLRAISTQLTDPGLSAATIAAQLGVTPRYVHLLLEQSGRTFSQHVLQGRLEKAEQHLSDDTGQCRRIADIALEAGFSDLSYFNRTFRRHFGDTPTGIRANGARRRTEP